MSVAMKMRAIDAYTARFLAIFVLALLGLAGCAGPKGTTAPERYDLGATEPAAAPTPSGMVVWLSPVQAPSSLDGTHMLYRLEYSNALQTRAYAQARWSMPIPELFEQRLRQRLSGRHAVLNPADGVQGHSKAVVLRVELEDFSQSFSAANQASVRVRVRATLSTWRGGVEHLVEQQSFEAQQACASADAPGGVRALSTASDAVLATMERWLDAATPR